MSATRSHPCLECGNPVPEPGGWVCGPRCRATLSLVWSGRRRREAIEAGALPDLDVRRQLRAAGVVGRFPRAKVLGQAMGNARGRRLEPVCPVHPGCGRPATRFAWHPANPAAIALPRATDLHLLCDTHYQEAASAFVDAGQRIAHTAPATWARIEAAEPLVARDDPSHWTRGTARVLTAWPFGDEITRADLEDWGRALETIPVDESLDPLERWDKALDGLALPVARRRRLVRAIDTLALLALTPPQGVTGKGRTRPRPRP